MGAFDWFLSARSLRSPMTATQLATEQQYAVDDPTRALAVAAELPSSAHVQAFCHTREPVPLHVLLGWPRPHFTAVVAVSLCGNC